jgi:hypothetical protein
MNHMKWMMLLLVLVLGSARAQAQIPPIQLGSPSGDIYNHRPELDRALQQQLINSRFETVTLSKLLGERESSKAREWKSPVWVCWQSALGLVALGIVIGFLYGRFGPD